MKLIINGDDFGHTRGVNFGIVDVYQRGALRSTTVMANRPGFLHAMELAKQTPGLGVGVHLVLTCDRPLGKGYKTIVREDGFFYRPDPFEEQVNFFDLAEVEAEYVLQIEKVLENGITPTHLDGHHHTHINPVILPITLKLADRYGLPIRAYKRDDFPDTYKHIKTASAFNDCFYDEDATLPNILRILEQNKNCDVLEIMCHPAYVDQALIDVSEYTLVRARELEILTSPELLDFIKENQIELVNYSALS